MRKGHTRRPAGAKATVLGSLKARWRTVERLEALMRIDMASRLRGIAAAPHVAGSCQGIANLKARAERSPRGEREADFDRKHASFRLGASAFQRRVPPGELCASRAANRVLQTPSGYTQSLIVCRSRHRSIGRLPRESGSARRSRPPSTYDDVRASWRAPKSVPWSRRTPQPGCSTAPTSQQ